MSSGHQAIQRSSYNTLLRFANDVFREMAKEPKATIKKVMNMGDRLVLSRISGDDVYVEESGGNLEFTVVSRIKTEDVQATKQAAESSWTHYAEPGWDIDITTLSADELGITIFRTVEGGGLNSGTELSIAYSKFSGDTALYFTNLLLSSGKGQKSQISQTVNYPVVNDRKNLLILGGFFTLYSLAAAILFSMSGNICTSIYPAVVMLALSTLLPFAQPARIPGILWQGMAWAMMGVAGVAFFGLFFTVITFPMVLHVLLFAYAFWKVFDLGKKCTWASGYIHYVAIGLVVSAIVSGAVGFILV